MTNAQVAQTLVGICAEPNYQVIKIEHDWFQPHECAETKQAILGGFEFVKEWDDEDGHHWAVIRRKE